MSATRYTFDRHPSQPVRLAICDWLERHGIHPNDVAVPGWIELRPNARQVAYEGYAWETVDGRQRIKVDDSGDDAVRVERVHQLESPPMAWPDAARWTPDTAEETS